MNAERKIAADAPVPFTRRTLLKLAAAGVIGATVGAGASVVATRIAGASAARRYRFLTDTEAALLIDICEQIIPRDDAPGATDAGVVTYIDRQLAGFFARHQPAYRRGLAAFNRSCADRFQVSFHELTAEKKVEFLQLVEGGKAPAAPWNDPSQKAFFQLVLDHTMQGFYGSPRHGGNRGYMSYKMLGLDYPQVIGQNRHVRT